MCLQFLQTVHQKQNIKFHLLTKKDIKDKNIFVQFSIEYYQQHISDCNHFTIKSNISLHSLTHDNKITPLISYFQTTCHHSPLY